MKLLPGTARGLGVVGGALIALSAGVFWARADAPPATRSGASLIPDENARRPAEAVPGRPLTLEDCYQLAVVRSEQLGIRLEDIRAAQARYWGAIGAVLPNIRFFADQEFRDVRSSGGRGGGAVGGFSPDPAGAFSGTKPTSFDGRFNLSMPLFQGFRDIYAVQARRSEIYRTRYDRQRAFQNLYLDVADLYFQILRDEADLKVLKRLEQALEERVTVLRNRIRLGKSRPSEALQAQTDLANARVTTERTRGILGASRQLLAFLIGIKSEDYTLKPPEEGLPSANALENYLRAAETRPDVLALVEAERAAAKQVAASKALFWPKVSLESNWYAVQDPKSSRDWDVLLRLDLPIFDGTILPEINENKALLRQSQLNLSELRRLADRDVRVAYNDFNASIAEYIRLQDTIHFAAQNYQAQQEDFELGRANNLDVLVALQSLQEAYRQLIAAAAAARVDLVSLHVASGRALQPAAEKQAPDSVLAERVKQQNRPGMP